jgi:hypothetical protein
MVVPSIGDSADNAAPEYPSQIQDTLDSAVQRQREITQTQISEYTERKKQEFRSWREQVRKQAKIIATIASTSSSNKAPTSPPPNAKVNSPNREVETSEYFRKSPVTVNSRPGASPLAAASLTRSYSDRRPSPSPSPPKVTSTPVPLSSSLKSPGSSNYQKTPKRVMFQDPVDDEPQSGAEKVEEIHIPSLPKLEPSITVDGMFYG